MNHHARAGLAGLVAGLTVAISAAAPASAATATIDVPTDFVAALSDTRATGHYEVVGTGLRVWTEGSTSTDKVAEYVAAPAPLAVVGEPNLEYTPTSGSIPPGFQLVVDFDDDGGVDGILVGESVYAGDWWLSNSSAQFVKDGAPSHTGGSGSANHGTLDAWRAAFPQAQVEFIGFSLGSGVLGDGVILGAQLQRHALHLRRGRRARRQAGLQGRRLGHQHRPGLPQPGRLRQPLRLRSLTRRSVRAEPGLRGRTCHEARVPSSVGV